MLTGLARYQELYSLGKRSESPAPLGHAEPAHSKIPILFLQRTDQSMSQTSLPAGRVVPLHFHLDDSDAVELERQLDEPMILVRYFSMIQYPMEVVYLWYF